MRTLLKERENLKAKPTMVAFEAHALVALVKTLKETLEEALSSQMN